METTDTMYGSDRNGLVWAYLFGPDQVARPIDAAAAAGWISINGDADRGSFLWLHCSSVALVERVKLLQEELAARATEQTNRTLFVLTVVTVLAVLAAFTTGLGYLALRRYRD